MTTRAAFTVYGGSNFNPFQGFGNVERKDNIWHTWVEFDEAAYQFYPYSEDNDYCQECRQPRRGDRHLKRGGCTCLNEDTVRFLGELKQKLTLVRGRPGTYDARIPQSLNAP